MSKRSMDFDGLLQAYSQHPASVIEEIIRSTYHFTLSLAIIILQDVEDALLTTRAVYQQAFINLDAYPTGTNFEGWMAAISIALSKKKLRRRQLQAVLGSQIWSRQARAKLNRGTLALSKDQDRERLAAVYELPEGLRVPAFLHFSQKFSLAEIAQILNTSESKINRRVASAVLALQESLTLSDSAQDFAPIEMVLANPLKALGDSESLQPGQEEIKTLARDISFEVGGARSNKLWRKHVKEASWTLMVISLVLIVGWVFSRRSPDARLEPQVSPSATPLPLALMVEREFLFLEEDQNGDGSQNAFEPEGSWEPEVSADGGWVVFSSSVSNLVENDHNGKVDIFIYDREQEQIERVSVGSDGQEADRNSFQPGVSGDGRYVVFTSTATNLDPRDNQICGEINTDYNCFDVFLHDRDTGETRMISVTSAGEPANNLSVGPAISADGEWVVYWSLADNLVPGDAEICGTGEFPYNCVDIFLHSLRSGTTERIQVGRALGEGETPFPPLQLSADGGRLLTMLRKSDQISPTIALENEEDIFVFDRERESWTLANIGQDQQVGNAPSRAAGLSGDGRYVAFASAATNLVPSDFNRHVDVFLRNLENEYTDRISEVRSGEESDGDSGAIEAGLQQDWIIESLQISQDARWLLFISKASNLSRDVVFDCSSNPSLPGESYLFCYHLFLHDRLTRVTRHIYGPLYHFTPYTSISGDGRWVTFLADTTECYSRGFCTEIFLYDRLDRSLQSLQVASADKASFIPSSSDIPRWSFVNVFRGHRGWVTGLAFTPDNTGLASVAFDRSVRLWTIPIGDFALLAEDLESAANVVAGNLSGDVLATGTLDGATTLWQLPGGRLRGVIDGQGGAVLAMDYSPDGEYLAIGARKVTLYQADQMAAIRDWGYPRGTINSLDFSPDGQFLAVGNSDHSVWVHRVVDGEMVLRLGSHTRDVTSVAFSPDGKFLASGSADRTVNVWKLSRENGGSLSAALYKTFSHFDWVSAVVFSPDAKTLISGSYDGAVRIWTLSEGTVGNELLFRRPQDQIRSLSISADGEYLAAGTNRGEIYIWQVVPEEAR